MATRTDRIEARVEPEQAHRIRHASEVAQQSVSCFVVEAASARADEVLAERRIFDLDPEASAVFTEALSRPAEVNERLASALSRPRQFSWVD